MAILESVFGEKNDCQTGKRGRKLASLGTLGAEFGHASYGACYHSHGGNVLFPPWERMQSAILATAKCHTSDREVRNQRLQTRFCGLFCLFWLKRGAADAHLPCLAF